MTGLPSSYAPYPYKELLDGTFRVYRQHLNQIWRFSFLVMTPLTAWFNGWYVETSESPAAKLEDALSFMLEDFIRMAVIFPLMLGAFAGLHEPDWTWKKGFSRVFRHFGRFLAGSALIAGIQGMLFFLVMGSIGLPLYFIRQAEAGPSPEALPETLEASWYVSGFLGLFLLARLAFILPAVVGDGMGLRQAIRKSWELSRGAVLKTAGILLLLMILEGPFLAGVFVLQEWRYFLGITEPDWLWTVLDFGYVTLVRPLLEPLVPLFLILLYRNRQARLEGTDLMEQFKAS